MCRFPKGKADFKVLRKEGFVYVDKTKYIALLENSNNQSIHFLRPRRFGKSLFTSMLECYYDVTIKEEFESLFQGTYIYHHPTKKHHQYYVLKFDFSGLNSNNLAELKEEFHNEVYRSCTKFIKKYQLDIVLEKGSSAADCLSDFIANVELKLRERPDLSGVYVIVDEYDHFANELLSFHFDQFNEIVSKNGYVRKFYEVLKKGTIGTISQIFITGVSPITMDSMTSGFNISTNLSLDPRFNEMLGFTTTETKQLLSLVESIKDPEETLQKMKQYYDGYKFNEDASNHVFNPNMTLYYLDHLQLFHKEPKSLVDPNIYSDYKKIENLLNIKPDSSQQQVIADLLSDQTLKCRLTQTYEINSKFTRDDFVSLLYYLGYLTICGSIGARVLLKVPNEVMKNVYFDYFRSMLAHYDEMDTEKDMDAIDNILYKKDNTLFVQQVENILSILDKRDYMKFDEGRLKVACAAICKANPSVLFKSEYPVPNGFVDFVLFPYQVKGACALIELKYIKAKDFTEQVLQEKRSKALEEITKYKSAKEFQNIDLVKWIMIFSKDSCVWNEKIE